ncbi:MAG TPA: hypothetical protein VHK88_09755 [Aquihabitans sp.]|jgi:hypothetical protein|nr:hypothetical protein [Aquihabitans sp.]
MVAALQDHALHATVSATAVLATAVVALLGWGPRLCVEQRVVAADA